MNELPKIAIFGYGSMGREIERLAREQGFVVSDIFDVDSLPVAGKTYDFDVAIDFTQPDAVISNAKLVTGMGRNMVIGTTGWLDRKDEARALADNTGTGIVYGSNFSVGVQMYFSIVEAAAKLLNRTEGYDIMLHEMHHKRKKDSPSGTALTLADIILKEVESKNKIETETIHGGISPETLHVSSTRGGEIMGTHTVYFDSLADTIEITHRARNRSGFASGALTAAKWILGKKGFYDFQDVMTAIWSE
jgi:4-hydroxy-tetrahydrodipicolinate reductase